jgi:AAA15 family ATPase/GTPase
MITAFTIQNFKAIGEEPVRIELKPITLLFGANSAGKSSIIDALNYAYEVFINHNLSAENLGLGHFERFIYRNELDRSIILTFELDFNLNIFDEFYGYLDDPTFKHLHMEDELIIPSPMSLLHPKNIFFGVFKAYVKVEIKWNHVKQKPYVFYYETGFNDEKIAATSFDIDSEEISLCYINTSHSIFEGLWIHHGITLDELITKIVDPKFYKIKPADQIRDNVQKKEIEKTENRLEIFLNLGRLPYNEFTLSDDNDNIRIGLNYLKDALPTPYKDFLTLGESLDLFFKKFERDQLGKIVFPVKHGGNVSYNCCVIDIKKLFSSLLLLPRREVERLLSICHIGPLREIPSINFTYENSYNQSKYWRWENGLAAWDIIYRIGQQQLDKSVRLSEETSISKKYLSKINNWLGETKLNTNYEVYIQFYHEIPSDYPDKLIPVANEKGILTETLTDIRKIINNLQIPEKFRIFLRDKSANLKLLPHEIGTGISQVLPVVVASVFMDGKHAKLVAIEQPELHVHPAIQVQLGDLFITESSEKKFFLIETHSEHLLLRLLRRINETFEGELPPDMKPCTANDVAIYYLDKGAKGMHVRRLEISEDGDSKGEWPAGFFEERRAELF